MLKTSQLAAILAIALLFVSILGVAFYSSPYSNNPNEQEAAAEQKSTHQEQEQGIIGSGLWRFLFPDSISVFTFWLVIATIVLAIVAVLQIGFLTRQEQISANTAQAAKNSADVAKQTLISAQRAWIRIDQIGLGGEAASLSI